MRISSIIKEGTPLRKVQKGLDFESYPMIYESSITNHEFSTIDEFADLYLVVKEKGGALLQGKPFEDGYQRRKIKETPTLDVGVPLNVLCVDIDKIPSRFEVGTPEHIRDVFVRLGNLWAPLGDTDCIWSYTSSAGVKTTKNMDYKTNINAHIYYLVEDIDASKLRDVIKLFNNHASSCGSEMKMDASVVRLTQPIYICDPMLDEPLDLKREFILRRKSRVLDLSKWIDLIPNIEKIIPKVADDYTPVDGDISDSDKANATAQIWLATGDSYGGMTAFIRYLKQRRYAKDVVQKFWEDTYDGSNHTLETQKMFDSQWAAVLYIEPNYFVGVDEKDVFRVSTMPWVGAMLIPDWSYVSFKALRTFGDKPLIVLLNSKISEEVRSGIYLKAKQHFTEVSVETMEFRSCLDSLNS